MLEETSKSQEALPTDSLVEGTEVASKVVVTLQAVDQPAEVLEEVAEEVDSEYLKS